MKKPDNRNREEKESVDSSGGSCGGDRYIRNVPYSNPVLAKNIPVIGDVFAKMQEQGGRIRTQGKIRLPMKD